MKTDVGFGEVARKAVTPTPTRLPITNTLIQNKPWEKGVGMGEGKGQLLMQHPG